MQPTVQTELKPLAQLFRALGDETRLAMVALLSQGELCVCHLQEALRISQPNASRHLALLRSAGLVEAQRKGNWVYYRLAAPADHECREQLEHLSGTFVRNATFRDDVARLLRCLGPDSCAPSEGETKK